LTASRIRIAVAIVAVSTALTLSSVPVRADTAGQLSAARARLAVVQAQLDRMVARYSEAQTRYANTQEQIDGLRAEMSRVRARMFQIQLLMGLRVRTVFETGGSDTIEILLTSDSFNQFTDRIQYLGRLAQGDSELISESQSTGEELRRTGEDLARLLKAQAATVAALAAQKAAIAKLFAEQATLVAKLRDRLAAEQAAAARRAAALAAAAARAVGGGPLQACPVGQPRSFYDDFGEPRYGGGFHYHQGIDILAPLGTPVYAAQSGRFVSDYNSLGGISANLYGDSGDRTYYAHMSSYAGVPSGSHVPAGWEIGHVGNTGDAAGGPYHLHFEYHPGGGAATDPYRMLVAVCG
jgi:murein DD-endopeptidase MepM/ murein hydrolase activator NlpD